MFNNRYQVFTIHVTRNVRVRGNESSFHVPVVLALLPNKKAETYHSIFSSLLRLQPSLSPRSLTADFEFGIWNAAQSVFPSIVIHGSFFHWRQALVK